MQTFIHAIPLQGTDDDIKMLTTNFNTMAIHYLGAMNYDAGILGMEPESIEYAKWVKASLRCMILPRLKQLLASSNITI